MQQQTIPCPVCKTSIPFDTVQLLNGVKFACPNCKSEIGLATESKPLVQEIMKKLEQVKNAIIVEKK